MASKEATVTVREAKKRLAKRYGYGLALLADDAQRAMLYVEVFSPMAVLKCIETGDREWFLDLSEAINSLF